MAKVIVAVTWLLWLAGEPASAGDSAAAKTSAPTSERATAGPVREMSIKPSGQQELECRISRPTGSHIAAKRCELKGSTDSPSARAARELAKNSFDELRRMQMAQQLVRQQALDAAGRTGP